MRPTPIWRDMCGARLFSMPLPEPHDCGANGVYYRLEIPYGRYILSTDLIVDADFINDESEPTGGQYLAIVTEDLLLGSIGTVLERGNAAE